MSTRAQIMVTYAGNGPDGGENAVVLYHHCDGMPSGVLPELAKAWELGQGTWQTGRIGYAATLVAAASYYPREDAIGRDGRVHPSGPYVQVSIEPGVPELYGDIEWFYRIDIHNDHLKDGLTWHVRVFKPLWAWDAMPTWADLELVDEGAPAELAARWALDDAAAVAA